MELFEEVLEELFATGISWIIGKAISILFVVVITQGTKILIKRIIKIITYREGDDKMKYLKNVWMFIWNNKFSELGVLMALGFGYIGYYATLNFVIANVLVAILAGLVVTVLSVFVINKASWETLTQIKDRLSKALLTKEQTKKQKELEKKIAAKAKELAAQQEKVLQERAKALVEAEEHK